MAVPSNVPEGTARPIRRVSVAWSAVAAILFLGLSVAYQIANDTPRGEITGRVTLATTHEPIGDASVYLTPLTGPDRNPDMTETAPRVDPTSDPRKRREVETDDDGSFDMTQVAAGRYELSATSREHSSINEPVTVYEAQSTSAELSMTETEPSLAVAEHQTVFGTDEQMILPVRGYVSGAPNDFLRVTVYRARMGTVLSGSYGAKAMAEVGPTGASGSGPVPLMLRPRTALHALSTPISDQTALIRNVDGEGFFEEKLHIPTAGPALYLIAVSHGNLTVHNYLVCTDTALIVKRSTRQLFGYVCDIRSGRSVAGAHVREYRWGRLIGDAGITGSDGVATINTPQDNAESDGVSAGIITVASRGDDDAVVSQTGSFNEDSGIYVCHTGTDRPIYRPGDTVQYRSIVRARNPLTGGYDIPRGRIVTMDITDPHSDLLQRANATTDGHGGIDGTYTLSSEAPSGDYSIVATVGGEAHSSDFTVASYRKPAYTVAVTPVQPRLVRGADAAMTISARYYYGAPAVGASVHYSVFKDYDWSLAAGQSDADDALDYNTDVDEFDGRPNGYYGSQVCEGTATIGPDGTATVKFPTVDASDGASPADSTSDDAPQAETYTLTATVTDDANREVDADGSVEVTAGDVLITASPSGYLAEPNRGATVLVLVHDQHGQPTAGRPVVLYAEYSPIGSDTDDDQALKLTPIRAITDSGGAAAMIVIPPRKGNLRIVATTTDTAGRRVSTSTELWVTDDSAGDLDTSSDEMALETDKSRYAPGDVARILVNAGHVGENVLLTLEGDHVYTYKVVPIVSHSTIVRIPILTEYGPNITLDACYVKDKHYAAADTALRVALKRSILHVTIAADAARYTPGSDVRYAIHVADDDHRPARFCPFTLGVVDEAIFALQDDDPTAIVKDFYPIRNDSVDTTYSFSIAYLGDADKSEPSITARQHFLDTARWMPDNVTDVNGDAHITVHLPDNLTTWRASVYACSDTTAVGYANVKSVVSKPLSIRLDTPRFLAQGDHGQVSAFVHNDTDRQRAVSIHMVAPTLGLGDDTVKTATVAPNGDVAFLWAVAADHSGACRMRVTAWTTDGGAQLTDGIETRLTVRPWGRTRLSTLAGSLGDALSSTTRELYVDPNAVRGTVKATVRITPSVADALLGGLDYLVGYPYGCTEQTLSRFEPDLLVSSLRTNRGSSLTLPNASPSALHTMVVDCLTRLRGFQHDPSGGWGWWQNDADDPYMTAYVLCGLHEARVAGFNVTQAELDKGVTAATHELSMSPIADRPFLAYALALNGAASDAAPVAAHLDLRYVAPDGLAYLVLTEQQLGHNVRSSRPYLELERRAHIEGDMMHWPNPPDRWNGSDRLATALALRAYLAADPNDVRIPAIVRWLMASRTEGYFEDTRDTAAVITAFCDLIRYHPDTLASPGVVKIGVNGAQIASLDLSRSSRDFESVRSTIGPDAAEPSTETTVDIPANKLHTGWNGISVTENSASRSDMYFAASLTQTVREPNSDALPSLAAPAEYRGLTVAREYRVVLDKPAQTGSLELATLPMDGRCHVGDNIRVRLTLHTPRDVEYILVEDPFAAGFEPTERGTAETDTSDDSAWPWWYSNVDVRDDRIAVFIRKLTKGTHVFEYNLHAQTAGTYRALPSRLQGMYAEEVHTESSDDVVEVTPR